MADQRAHSINEGRDVIFHDTGHGRALGVSIQDGTINVDTINVGDVDIASIAPGDNNIGNVDLASALPAGTNNIGDVDVLSIAAGDNNIGNVDLASAIPAGTNLIGKVGIDQTTPGTTNRVDIGAAIPAGNNNIGNVDVVTMPAITMPAVASAIKLSPEGRTKTLTTPGTAEPLDNDAGTFQMMMYVRAKTTNTGNIYFGSSSVDKTSSKQIILTAGQAVTVSAPGGYCFDLNEFYFDADVAGEGIDYLCL